MGNVHIATVPGSKSITNRALLLAALSDQEYLLKGVLFSDDSHYFLESLKALGFSVQEDETEKTVRIVGTNGRVPEKNAEIYVGSAGTAARFLTAMLAFSDGIYTIRASEQMARRPMKPLFEALKSLGAEFTYLGEKGHLPVRVRGRLCEEDPADKSTTQAEFAGQNDVQERVAGENIEPEELAGENAAQTGVAGENIEPEEPAGENTAQTGVAGENIVPEGSAGTKTAQINPDVESVAGNGSLTKGMAAEDSDGAVAGSTVQTSSDRKKEFIARAIEKKKLALNVSLDISESTQYLSALMMTASMLPGDLTIHITSKKKSGSYVEITRRMMEQFRIRTEYHKKNYTIKKCKMKPTGKEARQLKELGYAEYQIEADVSAACYFFEAALLTGEVVAVKGVYRNTMQGDIKFVELLRQMDTLQVQVDDCYMLWGENGNVYPGVEVNMNDFSDQAITLAALAPFASSPTVISGIAHTRRQESDRVHGIAENLTRMGIRTEETEDSIKIWPGTPKPCEIETYDDHRMAMGFSLVALRVPGMTIKNPGCCRKTFPEYFSEMEREFGLKLQAKDEAEDVFELVLSGNIQDETATEPVFTGDHGDETATEPMVTDD